MKVRILIFFSFLACQQILAQSGNNQANTSKPDSIQESELPDPIPHVSDSSLSHKPRLTLKEKGKKLIRDTIKTAAGNEPLFQNNERLKKREAYEKRIRERESIVQEEVSDRYKQHLDKLKIEEKRKKFHLSEGTSKRAFSNVDKDKSAYSEKVEKYKNVLKNDSSSIKERLAVDSTLVSKSENKAKQELESSGHFDDLKTEAQPNNEEFNELQAKQELMEGYTQKEYSSKQTREFTESKLSEKLRKFKGQGMEGDFSNRVKDSQDEISKYKKKYKEVKSFSDLKDEPKNPLKDEPVIERFIFGGNFQFHTGEPFGVDISPQISYLLFPKLAIGVGGTYRVGIDKQKDKHLTRENEVFGARLYSDFAILKNIYLHGEFETLRKTPAEKELDYPIDNNVLGGLMMKFKITKGVKGNMQLLYNFLDEESYWLDTSRLIYRIGFEIKGKKKKVPTEN